MKNIAIKPEDYTILAVDDIATNIMLLKAVLSRAKYKIVTASGGFEALEKVAEVNPDLILLDIMMPDMDGYEVLKRLKADPAHEDSGPATTFPSRSTTKSSSPAWRTTSTWPPRSGPSCSSATNCRRRSKPATRCIR